MYHAVAYAHGRGVDVGLDKALVDQRLFGGGDQVDEALRMASADLGGADVSVSDLYLKSDDPRARFSLLKKAGSEIADRAQSEIDSFSFPEEFMDRADIRQRRYSDMANRIARASYFDRSVLTPAEVVMSESEAARRTLNILATTFDAEGMATEDTYRTIMRMQQLSAERKSLGYILQDFNAVTKYGDESRMGLLEAAQLWLRDGMSDSIRFSLDDINRGTNFLVGNDFQSTLDEVLSGRSIGSLDVLDIDRAISSAYGDVSAMPLSKAGREAAAGSEFLSSAGLSRPMGMHTPIQFDDEFETVQGLLHRYKFAEDETIKSRLADQIATHLEGYHKTIQNVLMAEERVNPTVRDTVLRSLGRMGDEEAVKRVGDASAYMPPTNTGGRFERMSLDAFMDLGNKIGTGRLATGMAAVAALIAYNRKRNKDYTLNDM
ncbi:MAG: hypothetical protein LC687_07760, partial [Actinobacteria bacterium]|nr:hypothetical protein [Actinomycetota bacterium]